MSQYPKQVGFGVVCGTRCRAHVGILSE
jgi:hypothetical protein